MTAIWRGDVLCSAMKGRPVGLLPDRVTGISIDSRTIKPGEAFFAIKGEQFDGHDFATLAVKSGASLLVVSEARLPALGRLSVPMIVVPDVLAGLERAGIAARGRSKAKIIAVTGSVGKTTTKEMLRLALSANGKVHASDKSFNNHWGVPLTLARMPEDTDYAIFEIGMNHPGEIRPLVKLVRPHIGIITMVAPAHLGHFSSLEEVAAAKAEIFEGLERGGHALVNRDDRQWKFLEDAARQAGVEHVWGFGEHERSTFRLVGWEPSNEGSLINVKMAAKEFAVQLGAPGRHIAQNAVAVLGASYLVGADVEKAALSLGAMQAEEGRGRRHRLLHPEGEFLLIDESYNANPASMKAALDLLSAAKVPQGGRRIAVLGDMLELGNYSRKMHEALAGVINNANVDAVLLGGSEMEALAHSMPQEANVAHRATADELLPVLLQTVRPGDVVVVKSSKSIGFSRIVAALLKEFPAIPAVRTESTN